MSSGVARYKNKSISWTGLKLPELPDTVIEVAQVAMMRALAFWRKEIGPGHFEETAYGKYLGCDERVYQSRTPKYVDRKLLYKHHNRPLVWSGDLRNEFLKGTFATRVEGKTAETLHGVARWPGVNALRGAGKRPGPYVFQERTPNSPRKYAELTVLCAEDEKRLAQAFEMFFAEELESKGRGTMITSEQVESFAEEFMAPGGGFQG